MEAFGDGFRICNDGISLWKSRCRCRGTGFRSSNFWLELGGQLERLDNGLAPFAPPFSSLISDAGLESLSAIQRPPGYCFGSAGSIAFEPDGSSCVFSAAIRFGRANRNTFEHQQQLPITTPVITPFGRHIIQTGKANYDSVVVRQSESHTMLDFQAGKDFGLGLFGVTGDSILSAGVRFAQFRAKGDIRVNARPNFQFEDFQFTFSSQNFHLPAGHYDKFAAHWDFNRSFTGTGPSISWNASAPMFEDGEGMEFTFDWGVSAAVLFGRQKAKVHHTTDGEERYHRPFKYAYNSITTYHRAVNQDRSRSVVVPDVGGFAGASLKFPNAKVSLGYRADFFFGAIDGGIDTRKSENRGFFGPFASISVGLGD